MRTIEQLVGEATALEGLAPGHRARLARCARLKVFAAGDRLLHEGDAADEFFLIRRGVVAVETEVPGRGAVTLETLGPGEILGWSWLVPPYRTAFDAQALDVAHVIAFDGACLRASCAGDPALGFALLELVVTVFVRRLQETRMRLLDLYSGERDAG